ncbi:MAG: glutathione S-transferase N-terminal domain-containing protein [Nitrospiraceae bacterium]
MTFYHVHWCGECAVVREKLDELGLSYDEVLVPDLRPLRKQVYEVSGQYYVPMIKDGDTVLTETRQILEYLESHYAGTDGDARPPSRSQSGG